MNLTGALLWRLAPAFLIAALAGPAAAVFSAEAGDGGTTGDLVLVLVAPWQDPAAVTRAAGAQVVGAEYLPMSGLAGGASDPAMVARLHAAGAWAVLNVAGLRSICGA